MIIRVRAAAAITMTLAALAPATGCGDPANGRRQGETTAAGAVATPSQDVGTSAGSRPITGKVDTCALVSRDEMARIAGVEVTGVEFEMSGEVSHCGYITAHRGMIALQYSPGGRSQLNNPLFKNTTKVSGLGEDAEWWPRQAGLYVAVNGRDTIQVILLASSVKLRNGDLKSLALDIAEAALPRLPR